MNYTDIVYIVVAVLIAAADVFLIPWLKTKVDSENLNKFLTYVKLIVQAAEQIFGAGNGAEKKRYVLDALRAAGFNYSNDVMSDAIESAVLEMSKNLLKN